MVATEHTDQRRSPDTSPASPQRRVVSPGRLWLFRFSAVILSLLPFVALEWTLRWCGVGHDTRLVVRTAAPAGKPEFRFNPAADRAYYGIQDLWGPDPRPFSIPKPAKTYRIVVVGGSSVAGFPYPFELALPKHLEVVLRRQVPDRNIEVLNAGMIAIASVSETDIARQALACDPDLIVVHSGHNEFYGPGGSASKVGTLVPGTYSLQQFFKRQRSFQVLASLIQKPPQGQLIESLPRDINIPIDSQLFLRTIEDYRTNLARLVKIVKQSQTPILVSTVPSNLRDVAPLQPPSQDPAVIAALREADLRVSYREYEPAVAALAAAREKAPQDPLLAYRQAQSLEALERGEEAAEAYAIAADLDGCRFRAARPLLKVVGEVAAAEGVFFCDVEKELKSRTRLPAPGNDFFLEHVHYNIEGNWEAATILAKCIVEEVFNEEWRSDRHPDEPTRDKLLGITLLDRIAAQSLTMVVFDSWPFNLSSGRGREKSAMAALIGETFARVEPSERDAFATLEMNAMQHHLWHAMGVALLARGNPEQALAAFQRHIRRRPWDSLGYQGAAQALETLGKSEEAQEMRRLAAQTEVSP